MRWHWKAMQHDEARGTAVTYEFNLDVVHLRANPDLFPYADGHMLTLSWCDPFYPPGMGRVTEHEKFITEECRAGAAVVEAQGVTGLPIMTQQVTEDLTVAVALAKPDQRFGDDMSADNVFRVSYETARFAQRWFLAPVDPSGGMSKVAATAMLI